MLKVGNFYVKVANIPFTSTYSMFKNFRKIFHKFNVYIFPLGYTYQILSSQNKSH